jgi:hypothetical protein
MDTDTDTDTGRTTRSADNPGRTDLSSSSPSSQKDLNNLNDKGESEEDEELVVVIAGGMTSDLTYDGVDVCASRVAWEVDEQVEKLEKDGKKRVSKFSVVSAGSISLVVTPANAPSQSFAPCE